MSYFAAEVVPIKLETHPNADSLSLVRLTQPFQTTVVVRTEDWLGKEKGIYCPIDGILPAKPEYEFIGKDYRVRAKKLRGIFSQGVLLPAEPQDNIGDVVTERIGLTKYEPPESVDSGLTKSNALPGPVGGIRYTDVENIKRYPNIFQEDEEVVICEKVHGCNARYIWQDKLHVGSHNRWVEDDLNFWWNTTRSYNLEEKLKAHPDIILFGEIYGCVQDLRYDMKAGRTKFLVFDAYNIKENKYLDHFELIDFVYMNLNLELVPRLYCGPWQGYEWSKQFAEGKSNLANHIREGFVVKPLNERWNEITGRTILKMHGEGFLLRK